MDTAELVFVLGFLAALGLGWVVGYRAGSRDVNQDVAIRVDSLLEVGQAISNADRGNVPWSAVKRALLDMPHTWVEGQRSTRGY
jgi:hypothetical protein